jgi:hypothetical protein
MTEEKMNDELLNTLIQADDQVTLILKNQGRLINKMVEMIGDIGIRLEKLEQIFIDGQGYIEGPPRNRTIPTVKDD